MHLKKYKEFLEAAYTDNKNDPPEIQSDTKSFNDMEIYLKEFSSKKSLLDKIYSEYKDEKELISKLLSQKLINRSNDKKNIKFTNPLLEIYAHIAEKNRDEKGIEKDINKYIEDLNLKNQQIKDNPSMKDTLEKDIKNIQDNISSKKSELSNIKKDILSLQKSSNFKLNSMKNELLNYKKNIDSHRNSK